MQEFRLVIPEEYLWSTSTI